MRRRILRRAYAQGVVVTLNCRLLWFFSFKLEVVFSGFWKEIDGTPAKFLDLILIFFFFLLKAEDERKLATGYTIYENRRELFENLNKNVKNRKIPYSGKFSNRTADGNLFPRT